MTQNPSLQPSYCMIGRYVPYYVAHENITSDQDFGDTDIQVRATVLSKQPYCSTSGPGGNTNI